MTSASHYPPHVSLNPFPESRQFEFFPLEKEREKKRNLELLTCEFAADLIQDYKRFIETGAEMKSENELVTIPGVCWRGWPIWATSTTSGWLLNSLAINCRAIRLNRAIPLHRLKLSQFPVAWTFTRTSDTYLRANTSNRALIHRAADASKARHSSFPLPFLRGRAWSDRSFNAARHAIPQ